MSSDLLPRPLTLRHGHKARRQRHRALTREHILNRIAHFEFLEDSAEAMYMSECMPQWCWTER